LSILQSQLCKSKPARSSQGVLPRGIQPLSTPHEGDILRAFTSPGRVESPRGCWCRQIDQEKASPSDLSNRSDQCGRNPCVSCNLNLTIGATRSRLLNITAKNCLN
jgi:hypothetical protein